jgi:rhamnose utilization protein RhaD (predicted bifunctional aldolase and dehydrogenase)/NAD(P)-dependent dehydrogenase (short-subunit alcohol dehydrogenase family)
MRSRWSDADAQEFVLRYAKEWGEALALRTYSSRLLGSEGSLVLHGGGNTSVKAAWLTVFGEEMPAVFVKASGADLAVMEPQAHVGLDLTYLVRMRQLDDLSDEAMVDQLCTHLLRAGGAVPSIEALVHAFIPAPYVDHTHADAILALTNRPHGLELVREVMGEDVLVLPYITPGFKLAKASAVALEEQPGAIGMVWGHHGLVTWGDTARESYEMTIRLVSRAEAYLQEHAAWDVGAVSAGVRPPSRAAAPKAVAQEVPAPGVAAQDVAAEAAAARLAEVAPILRGLLAEPTGDPDRPYRRAILQALTSPEARQALLAPGARERLVSPPLTSDHLIRTKALPLWVDELPFGDARGLRDRLTTAVAGYQQAYREYVERHAALMPEGMQAFPDRPRVVLIPGVGAVCAGPDLREALITRDITEHTLAVKALIDQYQGLSEAELFRMEYRVLQHAKLSLRGPDLPLRGEVALVTGAAGAIGSGICEGLLQSGCLVAATDLPGEALDRLVEDLDQCYPGMVAGVPLDVTDPGSVAEAFAAVARLWGGVDLVIPNAGIAAVSPLVDLALEKYRRLEQVNVEGTLLVLAEAARMFKKQATGGDIVLISTKNVFAPGANFGAYSSTKAAAHQLARIASLELADDDVRVNMVAPDAVFSGGGRRSGLWAEVGPDRMKARGLDEAGLEKYYQNRNLLKARVTAAHVAHAVLFFATRQTPTTGATIPVDGGLPDSTPR